MICIPVENLRVKGVEYKAEMALPTQGCRGCAFQFTSCRGVTCFNGQTEWVWVEVKND